MIKKGHPLFDEPSFMGTRHVRISLSSKYDERMYGEPTQPTRYNAYPVTENCGPWVDTRIGCSAPFGWITLISAK